jgi:hypothetical protein
VQIHQETGFAPSPQEEHAGQAEHEEHPEQPEQAEPFFRLRIRRATTAPQKATRTIPTINVAIRPPKPQRTGIRLGETAWFVSFGLHTEYT